MKSNNGSAFTCPIPLDRYPQVTLAHGGGGKLMRQLIEQMFIPSFSNQRLLARHDGAALDVDGGRLAFTTDSYVVQPLFFPGGDIGSLAVHGTVNDLAMCGARPLYLSCGLILEEGLPMETLWRVVESMRAAADAAGVELVTGDTKVVDRGKGDGVFINTAGIGRIEKGVQISPANVQDGDVVLLSGDVGRHGIAIMAEREGLRFETTIESDSAPVSELVAELLQANIRVHCLRDLTRGGLASALVEIAETAGIGIEIDERSVPVAEQVKAACELLGLDPMYVANEGRFIAFVAPADEEKALEVLRCYPIACEAATIGVVKSDSNPVVTMTSLIGARRVIDMLSGEQLPRIC